MIADRSYEDLCLFINPDDTHPFQLAVFQDEFDFDILLGFTKYKWILRNLTRIPQESVKNENKNSARSILKRWNL